MFSLDKLVIIIVLYKQKLKDALPFMGITSCEASNQISWYVYDNSTTPDADAKNYHNVSYYHDPKNPGVSAAYNRGANYARSVSRSWLLLFDQDTEVPENFLFNLQLQISTFTPSQLYSLRLFSAGALLSPCGYRFKRGYSLNNIEVGQNSIRNISFLNSGLLLSIELFYKAGQFDESVPLYFSDFVFVNRLRKVTDSFVLLPIDLKHSLSSNNMSNEKAFRERYEMYLKGKSEAINSEGSRALYEITALLRALKLTAKLRSAYYLKCYWISLIK